MSRLYDCVDPTVVSESLLSECIKEQKPEGEAGRVALEEGINFIEVQELRLDFKNILKIENLWQFKNLRKLQLDNNIIEKIVGLDTLVHLKWLDLSFNNIETIEGLSSLTSLTDLSLSHNRIRKLEGLDSLVNLLVLSIGHNALESMEEVVHLRRLCKLKSLNLSGNPLCKDKALTYPFYVLAVIPQLIYLDFQFILPQVRSEACKTYAEVAESLELKDRDMERQLASEREEGERQRKQEEAFVDGIEGSKFFESVFEEDDEIESIQLLPGVPELLENLKAKFVEVSEDLLKEGLEAAKKRSEERDTFTAAYTDAKQANKEQALEMLRTYECEKQQILGALKSDPNQAVAAWESHSRVTVDLKENLIRLEMQLVEQLDEITKEFERQFADIVQSFQENVQAHMTQCRELEGTYHEKVTGIATQYLEKFSRNELEGDECSDQLKSILMDKDGLMSSLGASHDTHLLAIDNKEDTILQGLNKDKDNYLEKQQRDEIMRNRNRILEIINFVKQEDEAVKVIESD